MTKLWPNLAERCWAASRAIISVLPPAPNGTTTVTGRVGQSAACKRPARASIARIAVSARSMRGRNARVISFSLRSFLMSHVLDEAVILCIDIPEQLEAAGTFGAKHL